MLTALATLLVPAIPQLDRHSTSHPAEASLYWEIASTADILSAYRSSGWAAVLQDEEIQNAMDALMASSEVSWSEMQAAFLDGMRSNSPALFELEFLQDLLGSSVSLTVQGGDLGAWIARSLRSESTGLKGLQAETHLRALFDFGSEESAAAALDWVERWTADSPMEGAVTQTTGNNWRLDMRFGSLETGNPDGKESPSLAKRWGPIGAGLGDPAGTTLVSFWNAGGTVVIDQLEGFIPYSGMDGPFGHILSALTGSGLRMLSHGGAWRVTANDGEFRTVGLTPRRPNTAVDEAFGDRALVAKDIELLHPDAVLGGVIGFEQEALAEWMKSLYVHPEIQPSLQRLEDLYGLDRQRHLLTPVGGAMGWSVLGNFGLGAPPIVVNWGLSDPVAAEEALAVLAKWVAGEVPGAEVVQRTYKKIDILTLKANKENERIPPQLAGAIQPSFAVVGDRLIATLSSVHLKREVKRLRELDDQAGALPPSLASSKHWEGSSQVSFGDWMGLLSRVYQLGKSMAPLIAANSAEPPFDISLLPPAELVARHFQPSVETHRSTPLGYLYESRSSVGPESNVAVLLLTGLAAYYAVPSIMLRLAEAKTQKVNADLSVLNMAITQFAINNAGRYPEALQALVDPDSDGQRYLRSEEIPKDAWGNAYLYQADGSPLLWSSGPDGVNQNGAGDDITIDHVIDGGR